MKIYIASLPRSGSTLLQNMIATDERIFTLSEGWIELHFESLSSMKIETACTYGNTGVRKYLEDLSEKLDIDRSHVPQIFSAAFDDYLQKKIRIKYGGTEDSIILDKTPRYFYIIDELLNRDNTKVIILRRHPVAVIASYEKSFCKKLYKLPLYLNDFRIGYESICQNQGDENKSLIKISYLDLIDNTESVIKDIEEKASIHIDLRNLNFEKRTGRLGDPNYGSKKSIERSDTIQLSLTSFIFINLFLRKTIKKYNNAFPEDNEDFIVKPIFKDFIYILSLPVFYIAWVLNLKVLLRGFFSLKGRLL